MRLIIKTIKIYQMKTKLLSKNYAIKLKIRKGKRKNKVSSKKVKKKLTKEQ